MQKILVVGKTGQLAQAIAANRGPWEYEFLGREKADLSDPDQLAEKVRSQDFDLLINTAAYTAVDKAEEEEELAIKVNGEAPGLLAKICAEKGAVMIHISTDYVFGLGWNRPLREDDPTDPINAYGRSKWEGEEAIRMALNEHIIIRTSWLYGLSGHNFPKTMLHLVESRKELKVVFDQVGNPTFANDLAAAIETICGGALKNAFGTYHFSNEGVCSWYDFAREIFHLSGKSVTLEPVTSDQFPTAAKRPHYSVLNKKKIKDTFGLKIRHWQDALADFHEKLNS
ncbi:MAG TPA: dTDP-4-dehydrorhamnose reductase [Cryomorphaceae bacterium]|nr:dTDP-4-dehydrorhamnose reductase [Cryomorphaceae bacterium]